MKTKHEPFPKKGSNPHDSTGRPAGVCPKCKAEVFAKPGFRFASLKCAKCGAAMK